MFFTRFVNLNWKNKNETVRDGNETFWDTN